MPFGFDPRKLIDEEKENKKVESDGTIWKQAQIDQEALEIANNLRRKSNINKALTTVDQNIREFKFEKEHGEDAYIDAKLKQNPEYRDKRLFTEEENKAYYRDEMTNMKGLLKGVKVDWATGDDILPDEADMNENQLKFYKKGKYATIQKEYGEKPEQETYKNLAQFASTNAAGGEKIEWKTTDGNSSDPFASDVGITESIYGALLSGVIKIPKGFANLGAMIMDATGADDVETGDAERSKVAQLERWWDNTYFGMVEAYGESKARETAVGKITEMLVQIYGGWATVGKKGVNVVQKSQKIYNKAKDAVKNGSYMRTYGNKNLFEGAKKAAELNKLSRTQQYVSWAIGGGVGGAVVYKNEGIGTFGDIEMLDFIPTGLDRETRATAKDDATRMLYNKLKFSTELGFLLSLQLLVPVK